MADQLYTLEGSTGRSTNALAAADSGRLAPSASGNHYGILINTAPKKVYVHLDMNSNASVDLTEINQELVFTDLSSNDAITKGYTQTQSGSGEVALNPNTAYLFEKTSTGAHGVGVTANGVRSAHGTSILGDDKYAVVFIDRGTNLLPTKTS